MSILDADFQGNQAFSRYQQFLLYKVLDLYKLIERAGTLNDFDLGFRILGELQDREEITLSAGLNRQQITEFVNFQIDNEATEGDAA